MARLSRAQAALEFLMTYGWAILIMLVVIALLFFLGVFNVQSSVPRTCILPAGLTCAEFDLDENGKLSLDLGQATGKTITVTGIGCDSGNASITPITPVQIQSGSHAVITGSGIPCFGATSPAFRGKIAIRYTSGNSPYSRTASGQLGSPVSGAGSGSNPGNDTSLMLFLKFDNNTAIGDTNTTIQDLSPYNRDALLRDNVSGTCGNQPGCPSYVPGRYGMGVSLDGVNDYMHVAAFDGIDLNIPITYEAWVKVDSYNTYWAPVGVVIVGKQWADSTGLLVYDGYPRFTVFNATSPNPFAHTTRLSLGTWYHIAGTYEPGTVKICVNGNCQQYSTSQTPRSHPAYTLILGKTGADYYPLNGSIDEVKIYNRSLSTSEIMAHYQQEYP